MEESFNWLRPIISSSTNQFHIDCCKNLLKLFADKYNSESQFAPAYKELSEDLNQRIIFLKIDV